MASQHIQKLLPRHHLLLRMVLEGTQNMTQMATTLGYTVLNLRLVIDSPIFQMELARRRKSQEVTADLAIRDGITAARDHISTIAYAAAETLEKGMIGEADEKQVNAADKVLKYAFPRSLEQRGSVVQQVVVLSGDKLARLREALSQSDLIPQESKHVESTLVA